MLFCSPLHEHFSTIKHLMLALLFKEVIGKNCKILQIRIKKQSYLYDAEIKETGYFIKI